MRQFPARSLCCLFSLVVGFTTSCAGLRKMTAFLLLLLFLSGPLMAFDLTATITTQMLLVLTEDWKSSKGELQRFERHGADFLPVGAMIPVVVGLNGLAWGKGLQPQSTSGAQKMEGDKRAPAGVFRLRQAMGYARQASDGMRWPYVPITATSQCVDDVHSTFYNAIMDTTDPAKTRQWKSSEPLHRSDGLYKWLIVVGHNDTPKPDPGRGSCVFLHVWRAVDKGTLGCTAMAEQNLVEILRWLALENNPLLVQLPRPAYRVVKANWHLP